MDIELDRQIGVQYNIGRTAGQAEWGALTSEKKDGTAFEIQ